MRFQHSLQYFAHTSATWKTKTFSLAQTHKKKSNEVRTGLHRGQSVRSWYLKGFLHIYEQGSNTFCRYTTDHEQTKQTICNDWSTFFSCRSATFTNQPTTRCKVIEKLKSSSASHKNPHFMEPTVSLPHS